MAPFFSLNSIRGRAGIIARSAPSLEGYWQVWLHWNGADAASLGFCTVITPGRLLQNLPLAVIVLNVFAPGSAPFIFSFLGATPPTSTTASCVKCEPVIVNKNVPFDARSTEHAVTAATSARGVVTGALHLNVTWIPCW